MKLATLNDGSRDGCLAVVSRDLRQAARTTGIAATLQEALERWGEAEPALRALSERLEAGTAPSEPFDQATALAPLPRAWQWLDGSAFECHGVLMSVVFKRAENPFRPHPLMYQGLSNQFLAGHADVKLPSEEDGIDFEGEFGIITDEVPLGVSVEEAAAHIKLLVLINDWSLRVLAAAEMKTGFGWVQAKPPCSMAPVAVTPDELGSAWREARVHLPLEVRRNGVAFGAANGGAMGYSFAELVAHAARTRVLTAGTIIGSGTVSNENYREIGSSCIAERRGIEMVDTGAAKTGFMTFGERVRMESRLDDGSSVFGVIDQVVVKAK